MAVDKGLISGSMTLLILRLLEEKDMYGYEMIENLRRKSNDVFDLKAGTLYPILHGLEDRRYVRAYEESAGGKLRKYYSLTADGRRFLDRKKQEWREYSKAVQGVLDGGGFGCEGGACCAGLG